LWRDEFDAVGFLEIAKGIVARDDPAPVGRDGGDRRFDLGVERIELGEIGGGVRLIGVTPGGVGGDQRVADIGDIDLGVGGRLPGVWIGLATGASLADRDAI